MPEVAAVSAVRRVPTPVNEPVKQYAPGSPERAELKARYKQLAKRHHPDLHGGDKRAEERLKLINEAYTYLLDSDHFA